MNLSNLSVLLLSRQDNLAIWSVNSCYATNRVNLVNVVLCSSRYPPLWNPVWNLLASGYFKRKLAFRTQSALGSRSATEDVVDIRHRLREIGVFSCLFTALPLWDPPTSQPNAKRMDLETIFLRNLFFYSWQIVIRYNIHPFSRCPHQTTGLFRRSVHAILSAKQVWSTSLYVVPNVISHGIREPSCVCVQSALEIFSSQEDIHSFLVSFFLSTY